MAKQDGDKRGKAPGSAKTQFKKNNREYVKAHAVQIAKRKAKNINFRESVAQVRIDEAITAEAVQGAFTLLADTDTAYNKRARNPKNQAEVIMMRIISVFNKPEEEIKVDDLHFARVGFDILERAREPRRASHRPVLMPYPENAKAPTSIGEIADELMQVTDMSEGEKLAAIAAMLQEQHRVEAMRANTFTYHEMAQLMGAAYGAAQQALAKAPKALAKWTMLYDQQVQAALQTRVVTEEQLNTSPKGLIEQANQQSEGKP